MNLGGLGFWAASAQRIFLGIMGGTTKCYSGNIGSSLKIMQSFCSLYSRESAQITIPTRAAGHMRVVRPQI